MPNQLTAQVYMHVSDVATILQIQQCKVIWEYEMYSEIDMA